MARDPHDQSEATAEREARRAAALRANLLRRKAGRDDAPAERPAHDDDPSAAG